MSSRNSHSEPQSNSVNLDHFCLKANWDDVMCPICLDFPHNGVLLRCSSHDKGCQPFICDTGHTHSNCLDRFKSAHGMSDAVIDPSSLETSSEASTRLMTIKATVRPICPLCRGEVTGWIVVDEARIHLNTKKRFCEVEHCAFIGNYSELQKHAEIKHPHSQPSKIDPARQLDWENFQQSSEIVDVLSTIQSEVPHGVVLGDYVIEYGEDDRGEELDDFAQGDRSWWTSCILYQVFDNFRASRNRRRSRVAQSRSRGRHYDSSDFDDSSVASVDIYRMDETDDDFGSRWVGTRRDSIHRSSRRRRSRFSDH